jgi:8-oxo-dGTP pyrophosphatase MutT (NUDIX family)
VTRPIGPERTASAASFRAIVNERVGARVILFDQAGRVLLVAVTDPVDARRIWMTPGGGRDDGESDLDCARRELREETGVSVKELLGPVFEHEHVFRWAGLTYRQRECFYVASMEGSTQGEASPDQIEQDAKMETRWWTVDELRATGELVEPPRLHDIVEARARPASVWHEHEAAVAGLASAGVSVPEGSCIATGKSAISGSEDYDRAGRPTGVCPVCFGRFRVSDGLLPHHAPSANLEARLGTT